MRPRWLPLLPGWPVPAPRNVTIEGEIKIAPGKNGTMYVLDDEGREFKLTVFRKTAWKPAEEKTPSP